MYNKYAALVDVLARNYIAVNCTETKSISRVIIILAHGHKVVAMLQTYYTLFVLSLCQGIAVITSVVQPYPTEQHNLSSDIYVGQCRAER